MVIGISCPSAAFVVGVKSGSGSSWLSFIPAGSPNSKSFPVCLYSFQPLPARYPRTMASIGIGLSFFTIIERPIRCGKSLSSSRTRPPWFSTRCVGMILAACSNHHRLIMVSRTPLPGTPLGIITSNADMRSVATIRSSSPKSKFSRTFPLETLLKGSPSTVIRGSLGRLKFIRQIKFRRPKNARIIKRPSAFALENRHACEGFCAKRQHMPFVLQSRPACLKSLPESLNAGNGKGDFSALSVSFRMCPFLFCGVWP